MKKIFFVFVAFIFLVSCGVNISQENIENTWTVTEAQKTDSWSETKNMIASLSETEFCIDGICINENKPYTETGWILYQAYGTGTLGDGTIGVRYYPLKPEQINVDEYETFIDFGDDEEFFSGDESSDDKYHFVSLDRKKWKISNEEVGFMGSSIISKVNFEKLLVVSTEHRGCGGSSSEQKFIDKETKQEIIDPTLYLPQYPKVISYGNFSLQIDWENAKKVEEEGRAIKFDTTSLNYAVWNLSLEKDLQEQVKQKLLDDVRWGTNDYYIINFKEIPSVLFYYKANQDSSFMILNEKIADNQIDENWNLLDETLTKQILAKQDTESDYNDRVFLSLWYQKKQSSEESDGYDESFYKQIGLKDFSSQMMPLYRVKKISDDVAIVYPASKYRVFTMAELCKPLVYVYDNENRKNSLQIMFPQGGEFTKIIPDFTRFQTWDFQANTLSEFIVKNQKIDNSYLYYSAKVPNYQFNQLGWQVYGRDIEKFFSEKLDFIGFNLQEKTDFIDYWKTEFDAEKLYFVSFKFDEKIDDYVVLNFEKNPKRQMRVLLEAYALPESDRVSHFVYPFADKIFDEKILKKFIRSGEFDVFEWGGTIQDREKGIAIVK